MKNTLPVVFMAAALLAGCATPPPVPAANPTQDAPMPTPVPVYDVQLTFFHDMNNSGVRDTENIVRTPCPAR